MLTIFFITLLAVNCVLATIAESHYESVLWDRNFTKSDTGNTTESSKIRL